MSSPKMNEIQDPLAAQKTAAANIGLGNYQQATANVPALQSTANNLNQTQGGTLATESPLFQGLYNSLNQDVNGQGGAYSALTKNLLGSFDTQQNNTQQQLQQQLQAQGLLGSGAGMAVLGNQGVGAAQARAGLVDQNQINMMNAADQITQQLSQQNQLQGYSNPMAAIGQIQSLSTPPNFQDVNNTYYTPQSKFQTTADILGDVGSAAQNGLFSPQTFQSLFGQAGGGNVTPTNGAPALGSTGGIPPTNYYSGVNSMMNNPQLLQMLMASGGA